MASLQRHLIGRLQYRFGFLQLGESLFFFLEFLAQTVHFLFLFLDLLDDMFDGRFLHPRFPPAFLAGSRFCGRCGGWRRWWW